MREKMVAGALLSLACSAPHADEWTRCASIEADSERLICYDGLAHRAASTHASSTPLTSVAQQQVLQPPPIDDEKVFGLSKPTTPQARGLDNVRAIVDQISSDAAGNVYVHLDNNQLWIFNDPSYFLRKGDAIVITRAALKSFLMATPSRRSYRVRRLE